MMRGFVVPVLSVCTERSEVPDTSVPAEPIRMSLNLRRAKP